MFAEDKDMRLLILGILMGAGMSALYDLFKVYIAALIPALPAPFVITCGFIGAVGTMIGIFKYVESYKKSSKLREPAETK
jgi:hypothetical protein